MTYIQKVHDLVKKIPKGKVTTYGEISKKLGIDPRMVGWALHANKSDSVPCHRVVNREGKLAKSFAFDGPEEQKRRLKSEGITFKNESQVDLSQSLHVF